MINMSFEWVVSLRYLKAKQRQAFVSINAFMSIAGVCVGVMAMMVVLAVMTGFSADIRSKILGMNAHLRVMSSHGGMEDYGEVVRKIENVEGVQAAAPFILSQVMLRSGSSASGAILRGIDPRRAGHVLELEKTLKGSRLDALQARPSSQGTTSSESSGSESDALPGIILGQELARTLGASAGDNIYALSPFGGSMMPGGGRIPRMKRFEVVSIFESGMYDYDSTFAYVSIESAQQLLRLGQTVTGVEVKVDDIYSVDKLSVPILAALGQGYWTQDWMQTNRNFFSALKLEKYTMSVILILIVLVAAFNIVSTLVMLVTDKRKEIAILKSMGATAHSIMKIFMLDGLIIGMTGTVLGLTGGSIICYLLKRYEFIKLPSNVYYVSTLPVRVEALDVSLIALSAIVISFIATLYPSYQAARLDPAEALRYE